MIAAGRVSYRSARDRTDSRHPCVARPDAAPAGRADGCADRIRRHALLTAVVIELLKIALAATERTTVLAPHPTAGVCTLLVIGGGNEVRLLFHATASTSAVLDRDTAVRLRDVLDVLR